MGDFTYTDPFIALMDDKLDKKDYSPAGGPRNYQRTNERVVISIVV
jgi:hypothetical protein